MRLKLSSILAVLASLATFMLLPSCGDAAGGSGASYIPPAGKLGPDPDPLTRMAQIANERKGNFYYGRRYYVYKTRLWGYVRKPGQPWRTAKLVLIDEKYKRQPDRYAENGPANARYGFDQNYEYRLYGSYTGRKGYDPNSNQFLPVFQLRGYELTNSNPGWLFSRDDFYDPYKPTLRP